jgi:hypothetical protein
MSLEGLATTNVVAETAIDLSGYTINQGPSRVNSTGSRYQVPVVFNVLIPTGSAKRNFTRANTSLTIIDPNGEGTCVPRLVATASFKATLINSSAATPSSPFTSVTATAADFTLISATLSNLVSEITVPAAA